MSGSAATCSEAISLTTFSSSLPVALLISETNNFPVVTLFFDQVATYRPQKLHFPGHV